MTRVFFSAAVALVAAFVLLKFLPQLPGGKRLILGTALAAGGGEGGGEKGSLSESLVGLVGTTLTPLRPAGMALLDGQRTDVVSRGEFVAAGDP